MPSTGRNENRYRATGCFGLRIGEREEYRDPNPAPRLICPSLGLSQEQAGA
jgi:hypothetical protein